MNPLAWWRKVSQNKRKRKISLPSSYKKGEAKVLKIFKKTYPLKYSSNEAYTKWK
jgi:hypothetical protein